ncbi:MAG TPA: GMC family oxidoreductase [Stellaceae bacterium]|jgi:gluconate 2-dehydrogenase alpha chain|nr:GMC family oxidoreductase [Stellaceae bacterium]
MVTRLKEVDAVVIGIGWTGSILARELTKAGLRVVGLERGKMRTPEADFALPFIRDELKYHVRQELVQDPALETLTLRHELSESALPFRRFGAFMPGMGLGGAGTIWNGMTWRFLPFDHELRSRITARYGKNAIADDMTIADWAMRYDELEPYYERFEKLCGTSGKAGNLNGEIIAGGNPFEGPRRSDYPNPPLPPSHAGMLFENAAKSLGLHPYPTPSANLSREYRNPEGLVLNPTLFCGHCDRFGCATNSKASPNSTILPVLLADPRFELRPQSWVTELVHDTASRKVAAVRYTDMATGEEFEQPAGLVALCAYPFTNTKLLLLSRIGTPYDPVTGQGAVGKNYCYQVTGNVAVFFEKEEINPFIAAGANQMNVDDFNGDNFDHGGLGFFGGALIFAGPVHGRPIAGRMTPPGTPRWGRAWKEATAKWYSRAFTIHASGANFAHRANYLDLDPTYRDALGRPLIRMTYNFRDNDRKLSAFTTAKAVEIARAMNPTILGMPMPRRGDFNVLPYQSTHNTGGTIMGEDPKTSVVNRYLQAWEASNLFILGASTFPQNPGHPPTGAVGALAYWAADAIATRYLKTPGALVPA